MGRARRAVEARSGRLVGPLKVERHDGPVMRMFGPWYVVDHGQPNLATGRGHHFVSGHPSREAAREAARELKGRLA